MEVPTWRDRFDAASQTAEAAVQEVLACGLTVAQEYILDNMRRRWVMPAWLVSDGAFLAHMEPSEEPERGCVRWRDAQGGCQQADGALVWGQFHTSDLWEGS